MINKNHVYNFIFLTIFSFSLIIPKSTSHKGYDYTNILDKGPKSDSTQDYISIKDFDILAELGRGAFWIIYKAKYKINGEIYALKAKSQDYF